MPIAVMSAMCTQTSTRRASGEIFAPGIRDLGLPPGTDAASTVPYLRHAGGWAAHRA